MNSKLGFAPAGDYIDCPLLQHEPHLLLFISKKQIPFVNISSEFSVLAVFSS